MLKFDAQNKLVNPEELKGLEAQEPAPPEPKSKPFNKELRHALEVYREIEGSSLSVLAKQLGVSTSAVSKYLNGKPEGDVAALESLIGDLLHNAPMRKATSSRLFESNVTRQLNAICETIRKTNDVGGITGPAGIGKTCGAQLYLVSNPTAVLITATRWNRDALGMLRLLWDAVDTRGWQRTKFSRSEYMVEKFKESNRLIMIDNAHRLTRSGREFWFDFHDDTAAPICFIGNPEFLARVRENDQQFSRIGVFRELELKAGQLVVKNLLSGLTPQDQEAINDLALQVVEQRGHVRALKKQVQLAQEIKANNPGKLDLREAFKAAHTHLVRDYKLEC